MNILSQSLRKPGFSTGLSLHCLALRPQVDQLLQRTPVRLHLFLIRVQSLQPLFNMRGKCGTCANPKQEYKLRHKHAPIALRSKRPRSLTLPLPDASALQRLRAHLTRQRQVTHDQLQSPFFKLPFEIREKIWKYALIENPVVLVHLSKRLANFRCTWDGTGAHECCQGIELKVGLVQPMSFARCPFDWAFNGENQDHNSMKPGLLSLSKTCRRMYVSTPNPHR